MKNFIKKPIVWGSAIALGIIAMVVYIVNIVRNKT